MDRFSKLHPILHFTFFICVFVFCVSLSNPLFSFVILLAGLVYNFILEGKNGFSSIKSVPAILIFVSIFNFLFSHYGMTVLFTLGDTQFTFESLFYGFYQGLVLSSMLIWFGIFSKVIDSEKVIYIFRFAPKCALIFSMVLGFLPRFKVKLENIRSARRGLFTENENNSIKQKFSDAVKELSALITYSLESSIVTADSMKARNYNPKAVRYSRYKFKVFDVAMIIINLLLFSYVIYTKFSGKIAFIMNPTIYIKSFDVLSFILFCILVFLPIIIDLAEEIRWKLSVAKN